MGWLLKLVTGNPVVLLYLSGGIFLAGLAAGGSGAWWLQGLRLDSAKAETKTAQAAFSVFKTQVATEGKLAQERAENQRKQDLDDKEKVDAKHKATVRLLNQRIASMRHDADSSGRYRLPAPEAGSKRPDLACFDRTELERADREVLGRLRASADQGDATTIDLNTAKEWARVE